MMPPSFRWYAYLLRIFNLILHLTEKKLQISYDKNENLRSIYFSEILLFLFFVHASRSAVWMSKSRHYENYYHEDKKCAGCDGKGHGFPKIYHRKNHKSGPNYQQKELYKSAGEYAPVTKLRIGGQYGQDGNDYIKKFEHAVPPVIKKNKLRSVYSPYYNTIFLLTTERISD